MCFYQLSLESVLQLEPQVVGLRWHSWIWPSWSHPRRSGPHTPRHPHHRWVTRRGHPLRPHVCTHGGAVKAGVRRHVADVAELLLPAVVLLTVEERLHGG